MIEALGIAGIVLFGILAARFMLKPCDHKDDEYCGSCRQGYYP